MDSLAGPAEPLSTQPESANLRLIREAFSAIEVGFEAGLELLLSNADPECEFRPYLDEQRRLRGRDEVRAYYRAALAAGNVISVRPTSFQEVDGEVVVNGSIRVGRASGGFSESQLSWIFRFRDGLLLEAGWGPRRHP